MFRQSMGPLDVLLESTLLSVATNNNILGCYEQPAAVVNVDVGGSLDSRSFANVGGSLDLGVRWIFGSWSTLDLSILEYAGF